MFPMKEILRQWWAWFFIKCPSKLNPSVGLSNCWGLLHITVSDYWAIVSLVIILGSFFNSLLTGGLPLILAQLSVFQQQAIARWPILGTSLWVTLQTMKGVVFFLFTFYRQPDPCASSINRSNQSTFGASVDYVYGIMILLKARFII